VRTDGGGEGRASSGLRVSSRRGRGTLLATILGSGMAFLDQTVVNVALPTLGRELDARLAGLQWTVDAYLLTLGALLLLGGALGDRHGRRRVFLVGLGWFAAASALCGLAPSIELLVVARAFQGIGAALLVPGSLAILRGAFLPEEQGYAIGLWAGLSGVTTALGPLLGGWLVSAVSWRAIFFINLPLAALAAWAAARCVPEMFGRSAAARLDLLGAVTVSVGLGGVVFALIEGPASGWPPFSIASGIAGCIGLALFFVVERRAANPMLPLEIFRSKRFSGANATTLTVYFGLGGSMFLVVLQLQGVVGYSPLVTGAALTPLTALLLVLSPLAGRLSSRIGPRPLMTFGPLVAAAGFALLAGVRADATYMIDVLPGVGLIGLGLGSTVAPLTTAVLTSVSPEVAGAASGVNNAIARIAGLLAVAALPALGGMETAGLAGTQAFSEGYRRAMLFAAAIGAAGGLISLATIGGRERRPNAGEGAPLG
jgi:EmrB/QacA subfamily drug resistance transporter